MKDLPRSGRRKRLSNCSAGHPGQRTRRRSSSCPAVTGRNLAGPAAVAAEWADLQEAEAVAWVDRPAGVAAEWVGRQEEAAVAWVRPVEADPAAACPR